MHKNTQKIMYGQKKVVSGATAQTHLVRGKWAAREKKKQAVLLYYLQ
jgi:hypothetical protein